MTRSRLGTRGTTWGHAMVMMALLVIAGGLAAYLTPPRAVPAGATPSGAPAPKLTEDRSLTLSVNSAGQPVFSPLIWTVPAGARLVVTIRSTDPAPASGATFGAALVAGTIGGSALLRVEGLSEVITTLAAANLAETFTVLNGTYHVNVPIAVARGGPVEETFTIDLPASAEVLSWGSVAWNGGASTSGMAGILILSG